MTKGQDRLQQAINQLSLVMNVDNDIARACKKAEIHPDLAEVLLKMHATQKDLDNECSQLRRTLGELIKGLDYMTVHAEMTRQAFENIAPLTGMAFHDLFKAPDGETKQ